MGILNFQLRFFRICQGRFVIVLRQDMGNLVGMKKGENV